MDQRALELLEHGLKDMYDAEQRFSQALVKMERNADDRSLANGFKRHKEVTDNQVKRIEQAFRELGERPERVTCKGATGLIQEYDSFVEEHRDGNGLLDAFSATAGLKVEHYEIASYRTLVDLAEFCDLDGVSRLLKQNLAEEEQAAAEMMSAATKLGAKLAGASAAKVAARGVGASIDRVREGTFNTIGSAASVIGVAADQATSARRSLKRRATTARRKSATRAKSTTRRAKTTARKTKATAKRAKTTARRKTTATRRKASTRPASRKPTRRTTARRTTARKSPSRRTTASRSRSTGTRRRTTSRTRSR